MSSDLDSLIQLGYDIMAFKYYSLGTGAILFYDHLLTLADEVKYVWSGERSWTFWIFVINRYFPMTWQFWQITVSYVSPSPVTTEICKKTSYYPIVVLVVCTLLAQTVLTLRIYAVTLKNVPIAIGFGIITMTQCVLGICITILSSRQGAQVQPPIPLDSFRLCIFHQISRRFEVTYTSLSLLYDFLAFLFIVLWARKSRVQGLRVSTLLDTLAEDATCYFMVIFTSHFVLVMTLNLGRIAIQLLPGTGIIVYLPLMVSRIMLSLKKAADLSKTKWSLTQETVNGNNFQSVLVFSPPPRRGPAREEDNAIPLDTFR